MTRSGLSTQKKESLTLSLAKTTATVVKMMILSMVQMAMISSSETITLNPIAKLTSLTKI